MKIIKKCQYKEVKLIDQLLNQKLIELNRRTMYSLDFKRKQQYQEQLLY